MSDSFEIKPSGNYLGLFRKGAKQPILEALDTPEGRQILEAEKRLREK